MYGFIIGFSFGGVEMRSRKLLRAGMILLFVRCGIVLGALGCVAAVIVSSALLGVAMVFGGGVLVLLIGAWPAEAERVRAGAACRPPVGVERLGGEIAEREHLWSGERPRGCLMSLSRGLLTVRRAVLGASVAAALLCAGTAWAAAPSAGTRITFYFGLKRPEAKAQTAFFAVEQPGSPSYRRFLTPVQVSARYGASRATRRAFVRDVRALGLSVRIDSSGVFARVSGTVSQLERIFKVRIRRVFGNAPNVVVWSLKPGSQLTLPRPLRPLVRDIVPTFTHSATPTGELTAAARPSARVTATPPGTSTAPPQRTGLWTGGCAKAEATGGFSFAQVRHAYGIDQLGGGSGASVAVLNVGEGVSRQDITQNARCFGYPQLRSKTLLSDGQTSAFGLGTFEPEEDLALVRGMAPDLTSLTFSQVWLSPELWFLGASQVLDAAPLPDSFSISYGECERDIRGKGSTPTTRAGANLMDSLLIRLGLAGVGSYASGGDFGSTCDGRPFAGIAWPASSPFVTAVGGTQLSLTAANERSTEVVWNDLQFTSAANGGGAGGGGYSIVSRRPPFQRGLGLSGRMRTTPDVSAVASEFPGWPVVLAGNWVTDAGTSGSAPLVASAMAIISAAQSQQHRPRVGPANGLFYYLAKRASSSFWDVVSGNNTYLRRVPGFQAKPGYDLASGLGVPQFAAIASSLPPPREVNLAIGRRGGPTP
jgi:subtilase family serine protease